MAIPYLSNKNVACLIELIMEKELSFVLTVLESFQNSYEDSFITRLYILFEQRHVISNNVAF